MMKAVMTDVMMTIGMWKHIYMKTGTLVYGELIL